MKNRKIIISLIILLFSLFGYSLSNKEEDLLINVFSSFSNSEKSDIYDVVRVSDGDTIVILKDGV